jgi:hypothetical protein
LPEKSIKREGERERERKNKKERKKERKKEQEGTGRKKEGWPRTARFDG